MIARECGGILRGGASGSRDFTQIAARASGTVRALSTHMRARYKRVTALGSGAPWACGAAAVAGVAAGGYAALVSAAWLRYGKPARPRPEEVDPWLDRFMPRYDVAERHHARVHAPAEVVMTAAKTARLQSSPLVRAIFRAREIVLGAAPQTRPSGDGLLQETLGLGWGVLADVPGTEIVMGAVTQPWLANVAFRAVPPDEFRAFAEPGFVKIVWTLRADALGPRDTMFRTETRVVTTDDGARRRFRWYWARFSPGIVLIRHALIAALTRDAEQRGRDAAGAAVARSAPA